MGIHRIAHSVELRIRRLLGKGWPRRYFERSYRVRGDDAWHYEKKPYNQKRFQFIMDSIPGGTLERALELGCAEGHMTPYIAARARSVVAMDIADEAVQRARTKCAELRNVEFLTRDIRDGLPPGTFDAVIGSDLLYYLSPSELASLLDDLARALRAQGVFVAAESAAGAAKLPSRWEDLLGLCAGRPEWTVLDERVLPLQPVAGDIRVAVFQRTGHSSVAQ